MGIINFILNLAGILLWLNWRSVEFDPMTKATPATLAGTLRRVGRTPVKRWHFLAALGALLFLRALLYWQIGSAANWTPSLQLEAIAIPFRSDFFGLMLLFSTLSFAATLAAFYLWLLLLSLVNRQAADLNWWQRVVRLHLGRIDRWPWQLKLLLPLLVTALIWPVLNLLFAFFKIIPPAFSLTHRLEQATVIGLGTYLVWKFLIGGLLALHLLNNYVYLGNQPFWNFVNLSARQLLLPLRRLPLRIGKVDFAPVVGITLVFFVAESAERWLTILYGRLPF